MRRRSDTDRAQVEVGGIPAELLAGACIEVWADAEPPPYVDPQHGSRWRATSAWRNFREACTRHLAALGIRDDARPTALHAGRQHPWSYDFLAEQDPERLAQILRRRGLPPDWRPSPARQMDFFGPDPRRTR